MKSKRGATLIELILSMAIGSIVMASVADISVELFKSKKNFESKMGSVFEANLISKMLKKKIYMGGGNGIMPWQFLAVENNCAARDWFPNCHGTDRVTTATNVIELDGAGKKKYVPNVPVYRYEVATGNVTLLDPLSTATCPLDPSRTYQHVLLIDRNTNQTVIRWVTSVNLATCQLQTESDLQGAILNKLNGVDNVFLSSTLYLVDLTTFFLDTTKGEMRSLSKKSNSSALVTGEEVLLTTEVYDFQAALGFDVGLKNLLISDDNSNADEVLYNVAGDDFTTLGGGGALNSDLQALYVAFAVGVPQKEKNDTIKNYDGPSITKADYQLIRFKEKFTFRNLLTFQ